MKIIFLDIDGVFTTPNSNWCMDPDKFTTFKQVLWDPDVKIVISSSWRRNTLDDTIRALSDPKGTFIKGNPFPFTDKIIGITPRLYTRDVETGKGYSTPRGCEIQAWLDETDLNVTEYCIIDDINTMLPHQQEHLVLCDQNEGFTGFESVKVNQILKVIK